MINIRILTFVSILFCVQNLIAQTYKVEGKVSDLSTGEPLTGAIIRINGSPRGAVTDYKGKFIIDNLEAQSYQIETSFMGYETKQQKIEVADSSLNLFIQLKPSSIQMDEVVVTGTGTEHYLKDAPVQTEVISGKALKEYSGRDIEEVLNGLSSSLTFTPSEMGSGIHINGLKNDYILILIDGKRMNTSVGGQNDLSRINMSNIQRIEIVKGAASSLYGSDAIGGVINFITKRNKEEFSISNNTRIGEHQDLRQSNNLVLGNKRVRSTTAFNLKHTDGWKNTNQEWYRKRLYNNTVTRTVNRSTNYTVSENILFHLTDNFEISGDASYYEKWTRRPLGKPNLKKSDLYYRDQSYNISAKYKMNNGNWFSFDSSLDRFDYFYDYNTRDYTEYRDHEGNEIIHYTGDRVLQSSDRKILTNLKGVFYLGSRNTLNTGVEHVWNKLVAPYRLNQNNAIAYSLDYYIQDEWNITDRLNVTGGFRYGQHKDFEKTFTPKISSMYKLGDFNLRATYSHGFKAPTMKELYYQYYATIMSKFKAYYGDPNLKAQRSNYYSVNIEYVKPKFTASITAYHNQIKDMISLQSRPTSYEDKQLLIEETMHYVNLAKARTYGVDITFDAKLPHQISVGGGYSYLNAKAQRTDDETAEDYMQYVPMDATSKHNANLRVQWNKNWTNYKLALSLNGRYQSKRYYTSHGNAKGHQLWRLNSYHGLLNTKKLKLDLNAGIDNIFNYIDKTPFGHNIGTKSPGRNFYLSVAMKFQIKNS